MTAASRKAQRDAFLSRAGWGDATCTPLAPDASFRRYYRLGRDGGGMMLMDAPPDREDAARFVEISRHLTRHGIRVPAIREYDAGAGFVLLEDLGDDTFTRLLAGGADEAGLYDQAVDALLAIHDDPAITRIHLDAYDLAEALREALLYLHWFLPAQHHAPMDARAARGFHDALGRAFAALPELPPTLTLRDYHVDNLVRVDGACALLDYQDALLGSPAYDLASLLEDARRDVGGELRERCLQRYFAGRRARVAREVFMHHFQFWAAQRHLKVAGIFCRLWIRDHKPHYLQHLPRVTGLLRAGLAAPVMAPVLEWTRQHGVSLQYHGLDEDRDAAQERVKRQAESVQAGG